MPPPHEGFKYSEPLPSQKTPSLFVTQVCLRLPVTPLVQSPECWYCYNQVCSTTPSPALSLSLVCEHAFIKASGQPTLGAVLQEQSTLIFAMGALTETEASLLGKGVDLVGLPP